MHGADPFERSGRREFLAHRLVRPHEPRANVVAAIVEVHDLNGLANRGVERARQDLEWFTGIERLAGAGGNRVLVRRRSDAVLDTEPGPGAGIAVGARGGER